MPPKKNNQFTKKSMFNEDDSRKIPTRKNPRDSFFVKPSKTGSAPLSVVKKHERTKEEPSQSKFGSKTKFHQKKKSQIPTEDGASTESSKKPFDKKAWRLKKYSKKYKLQQWENKRNHSVLQGYYKTLKRDAPNKFDVEKIYNQYENEDDEDHDEEKDDAQSSETTRGKWKNKAFRKYEELQDERKNNKEEALKRKAMKEEALKEYKRKKIEKFKVLNKKTRKGQPVMKGRIELLLQEIEENLKNE